MNIKQVKNHVKFHAMNILKLFLEVVPKGGVPRGFPFSAEKGRDNGRKGLKGQAWEEKKKGICKSNVK